MCTGVELIIVSVETIHRHGAHTISLEGEHTHTVFASNIETQLYVTWCMAFSCLMPIAYCLDIVIYVDTYPVVGPTYACITDTAFVVFVIVALFAVRLPASASLLYN